MKVSMKGLIERVKVAAVVAPLLAQDKIIDLNPKGDDFSLLGTLTAGGIVSALIRIVLIIAALVFFFILVIGGIRWIMSGGDKAGTEAARAQITNALVGLVIVFAAWAIIQMLEIFFGIDLLEFTLPSALSPTT
jgi:hypothetical protein